MTLNGNSRRIPDEMSNYHKSDVVWLTTNHAFTCESNKYLDTPVMHLSTHLWKECGLKPDLGEGISEECEHIFAKRYWPNSTFHTLHHFHS
ncbi:hypothetical protein TNIN_456841 [Trichonephila inaurata madagascariensis]|uniref:Uncharacterized protein n=1 Tax=Trichonephila inaurata madagascariensis TaxID=2747483 RepID=A0A8X7CU87_9ARAC|nr:hypothetical protein TNIN_456841 [Trichonephila inaurata madagascariensis]